MEQQPGVHALVPDKFDVLMPAPAERHDKGPGFAQLAAGRVKQLPGCPKVDLRFFAWGGFDAHGGTNGGGRMAVEKAIDRRERASKVVVFLQPLPNRRTLDPTRMEIENDGAVGFERRNGLGRRRRGECGLHELGQVLNRG